MNADSNRLDEISERVIGRGFNVANTLGAGFLKPGPSGPIVWPICSVYFAANLKHIACSRHRLARPHPKSDAGSQTRALRRRRDLISRVGQDSNRHELNVPRGLIPTEKCSPHS